MEFENYFKGCKTVEAVKKRWNTLALKYHPDRFVVNKITDPETQAEYGEIILFVKEQYYQYLDDIEAGRDPDREDEEKSNLMFRCTMNAYRRLYCDGQIKGTPVKREYCKHLTFFIMDYDQPTEYGKFHSHFDLNPPEKKANSGLKLLGSFIKPKPQEKEAEQSASTSLQTTEKPVSKVKQFFIDMGEEITANGWGLLRQDLKEKDIQNLKRFTGKLSQFGKMDIPNHVKNVVISGNYNHFTVTITLQMQDGTKISRTFPEKGKPQQLETKPMPQIGGGNE